MLSVSAICFEDRFCLAERVGQGVVDGCTPLGESAWWVVVIEKPWFVPDGPFVCFLAQMCVENAPFTL